MLLGLFICCLTAILATLLASVQHIVGAPMIGLFIGIIMANVLPDSFLDRCAGGMAFSAKRILRIGIILAGGTLNFAAIIGAGLSSLPLVIGAIVVAFLAAWFLGRVMRVSPKARLLVGGGTSICGGTAIATLSAVIEAEDEDTAYAMTSIFLFDILAALIWPYVALALHFTPEQYGLLGGVAINDVSSVTAASDTYNALMGTAAYTASGISGGDLAMVVKLTRVAMLVVVALVLTIGYQVVSQKNGTQEKGTGASLAKNIIAAFPFYVLGFLALAIVNTLVDLKTIPLGTTSLGGLLPAAYKFCFAMALVAVGFRIKLKQLFTKGVKPVILGGLTWVTVSAVTILYAVVAA